MEYGWEVSAEGGVIVKNVVYREVFQAQVDVEKPVSSCTDLFSSFSQDAPINTSDSVPVFSPGKRG